MVSRIGIFSHNYPQSKNDRRNAGIFVYDLVKELSKKTDVRVFAVGTGKKLGEAKLWNPVDLLRIFSFLTRSIIHGLKHGRDNSVNVAMWAFPSGFSTLVLKSVLGTPYIVWCLGSDINIYAKIPIGRAIIKIILKNASFVLADGIELKKTVEDLGVKCLFVPSASRLETGIKRPDKKHGTLPVQIAFLGRLEKVKGPDILVEALFGLGKKIDSFRVTIIGDGSLAGELKRKIRDGGLFSYVDFPGNISDKKRIGKILGNSDWLIIPSRSDSIPLVFSEAMKSSLPVICSGLPDLRYLIKKYKVGYLFRPGSSNELSRILKELPEKFRERTIFSGRTGKAAEDFGIEASAEKLMDLVLKI